MVELLKFLKQKKKWSSNSKSYPRFPLKKNVEIFNRFQPKKSQGLFFLSSPNSYHGVSKFITKNDIRRTFIYGSFSLNKPVKWLFNFQKING